MKKWITALLLLLLVAASSAALAAPYGQAVIDGRNSTKVHLRERATTKSDSLGLYYTGTEVDCLSDPDGSWVHVRIGIEEGYMMSEYLRTGYRADNVQSKCPTGWISATNYARMRRGPSTEYKQLGTLSTGTRVTIMGETDSHWYYVEAAGEDGYVSANLVSLSNVPSSGSRSTPGSSSPSYSWRTAYRSYLQSASNPGGTYGLIFVDSDNVPELVIDTGVEASGCQVVTFSSGSIRVLKTRRCGVMYLPRSGLLCNSDGNMDAYYDDIYRLSNGSWTTVANGQYFGNAEWDADYERYICDTYVWNGVQVSQASYDRQLNAVFDRYRALEPHAVYDLNGVLAIIGN